MAHKDGFCRAPRLEMVAKDAANMKFEDLMNLVRANANDEKSEATVSKK